MSGLVVSRVFEGIPALPGMTVTHAATVNEAVATRLDPIMAYSCATVSVKLDAETRIHKAEARIEIIGGLR